MAAWKAVKALSSVPRAFGSTGWLCGAVKPGAPADALASVCRQWRILRDHEAMRATIIQKEVFKSNFVKMTRRLGLKNLFGFLDQPGKQINIPSEGHLPPQRRVR